VLAKTGNNETWLGCRYRKRTVQAERNIANLIEQKELAEAKLISENQLVGDFSAQLCETVRDDWEEVMRPQGTGQLSENDEL